MIHLFMEIIEDTFHYPYKITKKILDLYMKKWVKKTEVILVKPKNCVFKCQKDDSKNKRVISENEFVLEHSHLRK